MSSEKAQARMLLIFFIYTFSLLPFDIRIFKKAYKVMSITYRGMD